MNFIWLKTADDAVKAAFEPRETPATAYASDEARRLANG
jgi:hypothetical protein